MLALTPFILAGVSSGEKIRARVSGILQKHVYRFDLSDLRISSDNLSLPLSLAVYFFSTNEYLIILFTICRNFSKLHSETFLLGKEKAERGLRGLELLLLLSSSSLVLLFSFIQYY